MNSEQFVQARGRAHQEHDLPLLDLYAEISEECLRAVVDELGTSAGKVPEYLSDH